METTIQGSTATGEARVNVRASASPEEHRIIEQPSSSFVGAEDSFCWNDDARERRNARVARNSKNHSKSARTLRSPILRRSKDVGASDMQELDADAKKLSDPELLQLYATTIRLCAENRVNAVNSWQLNLIDYIAAMAFSRESGDHSERKRVNRQSGTDALTREALGTNFALAGSTIDAGVKIYSYRVDSVHNNAYRVLSGLSQQPASDVDDDDQSNSGSPNEAVAGHESSEASPEGHPSDRRKRIKHGWGEATLETNPDHITLKNLEEECTIDPLFVKLSELFDQHGSQELLLRVLDVFADGSVALDADEMADAIGSGASLSEFTADATLQVPAELFPLPLLNWIEKSQALLCPNFTKLLRQLEGEAAEALRAACPQAVATEPSLVMRDLSSAAVHPHLSDHHDALQSPRDYGSGFDDMELFSAPWLPNQAGQATSMNGLLGGCCDLPAPGLGNRPALPDEDGAEDSDSDGDDAAQSLATGVHSAEDGSSYQSSSVHSLSTNERFLGIDASNLDAFQMYVAYQQGSQPTKSLLSAIPRDLFSSWAGPEHWRPPHLSQALGSHVLAATPKRPRRKTAQPIDFRKPVVDADMADKFQTSRRKAATQLSAAVLERHCSQRTTLPLDHQYTADALVRLFLLPNCLVLGTNGAETLTSFNRSPNATLKTLETDLDWRAFQDEHFCAPLAFSAGVDTSETDLEVPFASLALSSDPDVLGDPAAIPLVDAPPTVEQLQLAYATRAKRVDIHLLKTQLWDAIESQPAETTLTRLLSTALPQLAPGLRAELSLSYVFIALLHLANERALILESTFPAMDDLVIRWPSENTPALQSNR
jgi:condensin complex subunit 2